MRGARAAVAALALYALLHLYRRIQAEVPSPYMDEVFHVPQAQRFCRQDFWTWDPKITTLPGAYLGPALLAAAASHMDAIVGRGGGGAPPQLSPSSPPSSSPSSYPDLLCSTASLRAWSAVWLAASAALLWRALHPSQAPAPASSTPPLALAMARLLPLVVVSFPPLAFSALLFYTDTGSTFFCLLTALLLIAPPPRPPSSSYFVHSKTLPDAASPGLLTASLAAASASVAILFRQTNVVWAAHAAAHAAVPLLVRAWAGGQKPATILSILLARFYPLLLPLVAFAAFVRWNGGIVVGDREAHATSVNFGQLGYAALAAGVYPALELLFIVLLVGPASVMQLLARRRVRMAGLLKEKECGADTAAVLTASQEKWLSLLGGLVALPLREASSVASAPQEDAAGRPPSFPPPSPRKSPRLSSVSPWSPSPSPSPAPSFAAPTLADGSCVSPLSAGDAVVVTGHEDLRRSAALRRVLCFAAASAAFGALIHLTCRPVHPYNLADNRHVTFYVFSRLFLPYPWLPAALAPLYVSAAALVVTRIAANAAATSEGAREDEGELVGWAQGLGWLLATAAVVVPSRLLELRYFAVPVCVALLLMWGPAAAAAAAEEEGSRRSGPAGAARAGAAQLAAVVAFVAHVALNAGLIDRFLHRPFAWADGSVARMMW